MNAPAGIPVYLDGVLLGNYEVTFREEKCNGELKDGQIVFRRNRWVEIKTPPANRPTPTPRPEPHRPGRLSCTKEREPMSERSIATDTQGPVRAMAEALAEVGATPPGFPDISSWRRVQSGETIRQGTPIIQVKRLGEIHFRPSVERDVVPTVATWVPAPKLGIGANKGSDTEQDMADWYRDPHLDPAPASVVATTPAPTPDLSLIPKGSDEDAEALVVNGVLGEWYLDEDGEVVHLGDPDFPEGWYWLKTDEVKSVERVTVIPDGVNEVACPRELVEFAKVLRNSWMGEPIGASLPSAHDVITRLAELDET